MQNNIKTLRIQNFKSIKDVTMEPRRVNLIIGMPNVGKSNILEAMSLLGGIVYEQTEKFMGSFIRYEEPRQLFYDNLVKNKIVVESDKDMAVVNKQDRGGYFGYLMLSEATSVTLFATEVKKNQSIFRHEKDKVDAIIDGFNKYIQDINSNVASIRRPAELSLRYISTEFDSKGNFGFESSPKTFNAEPRYYRDIACKPYIYRKGADIGGEYSFSYLHPPYGDNLIDIIQECSDFRKEVAQMFDYYGLKLLLRVDERRLEVIKDLEGIIYSYPYSSIADTLQRIIFYLAAIESNDDAVILLEEPEAHSYPVYVSMLGKRMVESRNNQFFVATHSPYLITEVLEQMLPDAEQAQELAIFVAYYEDYQTKVKQLSDEEVRSIRADGLDVFYNMDRFVPRPANG